MEEPSIWPLLLRFTHGSCTVCPDDCCWTLTLAESTKNLVGRFDVPVLLNMVCTLQMLCYYYFSINLNLALYLQLGRIGISYIDSMEATQPRHDFPLTGNKTLFNFNSLRLSAVTFPYIHQKAVLWNNTRRQHNLKVVLVFMSKMRWQHLLQHAYVWYSISI